MISRADVGAITQAWFNGIYEETIDNSTHGEAGLSQRFHLKLPTRRGHEKESLERCQESVFLEITNAVQIILPY